MHFLNQSPELDGDGVHDKSHHDPPTGEVVWVWDMTRVNRMMLFEDKTNRNYQAVMKILFDVVCMRLRQYVL